MASPAAKRRRIVGKASFGSRPGELSPIETIQYEIHGFKSLPQKRGEFIKTTKLKAHGIWWQLRICPRGHLQSKESTEYVSVYLGCLDALGDDKKEVKTKYNFEFGSKISKRFINDFSQKDLCFNGIHDFAERSKVISTCLNNDGTLVINVDIRIYGKSTWYPMPLIEKHMFNASQLLGRKLLGSTPILPDVSFVVGEEKEKFQGHQIILCSRAPVLYEFVQNAQQGENQEVEISNVSGPAFKILLQHIYADSSLPDFNDYEAELAKEVLLTAHRFIGGSTQLKLWVESEITAKFVDSDNAADLLLDADSHACPLLKEECMKIYRDNSTKVMASPGWNKVVESNALLQELLKFAVADRGTTETTHSEDYDNMDVRTLREKGESYNLDLDGTKEMLIQRLKSHRASSGSEESDSSGDDDNDDE